MNISPPLMARHIQCASIINKKYANSTVLDAGCRTMDLKRSLVNCREYFGTDFIAGENVFQCNLENTLPFSDAQFDVVVALDVLEHLNNPHACLHELLRVAKNAVIISLPNMYYIKFRWNFLRGKLSGKYAFSPAPLEDRHRWILSYSEAVQFLKANAQGNKIVQELILPLRGRTKLVSAPVERLLGTLWPDVFAYGVLFEIILEK